MSYVICALCGLCGKSLGKHVSSAHGMSSKEYADTHGQVKCDASFEAYSKQNKQNGDWIARANEKGEDLTDYKRRMARSVSDAIMAKPEERARRSRLLGDLNKTDEFRRRSSETAIVTSARPDVIEKRTEQLRKWRNENPDDFYEKCVKKFSSNFDSKPERLLRQLLDEAFPDYGFTKSIMKSEENFKTTKTKRRQLDALSREKRIVVEFDGKYHFEDDPERLAMTREKDIELNGALPRMGYLLVRISHDQFSYRMGGSFKDDCLRQLFDALREPKAGLVRIGEAYETANSE